MSPSFPKIEFLTTTAGRSARSCSYLQLPAFLEANLEHDPDELFQSDWDRTVHSMLTLNEAA
jgi:hypothetical protein